MRQIKKITCGGVFFPPREAFVNNGDWINHEYKLQEIDLLQKYPIITIGDEGGMFIQYENDKYAYPGIPCMPILHSLDAFKRIIKLRMRSLFWWLFSWEKEIKELSRVLLARYYLKPFYYSKSVKEIGRVLHLIFGKENQDLVNSMCMFLEFDSAYRFRIQAFLGNLNGNPLLKKNIKNILLFEMKCAEIDDEKPEMKKKWKRLRKTFRVLWLMPKFRRITKQFIENINLGIVEPTIGDLWWKDKK